MKSFLLSSLLLVSLVFSCGNDDDGGSPEPAMDLTTQIVGNYAGIISVEGSIGILGAITPATITRVNNGEIRIVTVSDVNDWEQMSFNATMSSATAFSASGIMWEGETFSASGTLVGDELTITFSGSVEGEYEGSK
ncbi:MAG: hypothetical protein AAGF87_16565 [Bacteroidota bacterium]